MTPIRLTDAQKLDIELALDTNCENLDALDADCAAYLIYPLEIGEIPDGKILVRTCGHRDCVNPEHLLLIPNSA